MHTVLYTAGRSKFNFMLLYIYLLTLPLLYYNTGAFVKLAYKNSWTSGDLNKTAEFKMELIEFLFTPKQNVICADQATSFQFHGKK